MTKSNFFKRLLPIFVAVLMVLPSVTAFAAPADAADGSNDGVTWEKVDDGVVTGIPKINQADDDIDPDAEFIANGNVRVSIIVEGNSTIGAGFDTQDIGINPNAISYRSQVLARQNAVANRISKEVLGGEKLDVVWNLTLAANIISANVPAAKIEAIKNVEGVKDVFIEKQYLPSATVEADNPNMSNASEMTGAQLVWANGYTGAGSKVAIIDTGLDTDHELFDAESFDYAIEQTGKDVDLLTVDDITAVFNQLNVRTMIRNLTPAQLYLSSKVPFAANYVDGSLDVTHDNDSQGEHGSHVAGIAAANRFVKVDGEFKNSLEAVLTQGEAPDAQILVIKVFGRGGGAYDSDYFAGIEDAIVLGADSVNLSLGSAVAGYPYDTAYNDILEEMAESNTVVSISMGNNSYWSEETMLGYNYSDFNNFYTGGSPGSYKNALTVASVDNDGFTGNYIKSGEDLIFYTENLDYNNRALTTIAGDNGYVYIDAVGTDAQFAAVADLLTGKVGLCNRGEISFYEKANACIKAGGIATVIANNQPGTIMMNLTGYSYRNPCVSITQADGAVLKANATETTTVEVGGETIDVYIGEFSIGSEIQTTHYGADFYTMSDFSSWGVPGDLSLKPEITAPGGNIYSVNGAIRGGQGYENMSGTSMAAPQITGLTAVLKQYIRENDLAAKTGLTERQLTNSLLMSTAKALIEEDSENYYSVMKQGAGLVDIDAAINAKTYIMMDESATASAADGKIKVELGDDPDRTGHYTATFTVNNFSDDEETLLLDAEFFTQDLFAYYVLDEYGDVAVDEDGNPVIAAYRDTWTYPLESEVSWIVDGADLIGVYDFDGDGICGDSDVQALLDFVTGNRDSIFNEDKADLDGDGDIDTYDAYLCTFNIDIPAGGSAKITAVIDILDADDFDDNGTYIEGYIFAKEADMEDGAIGVTHSIPVLGYYGSWSEYSWDDVGSYLEYKYGLEDRYPYMTYPLGANAKNIETYFIRYAGSNTNYNFGGNPYVTDEKYMPERDAISSTTTVYQFRFSQVRNSSASLFTVTDDEGNVYANSQGSGAYAAYYDPNNGAWYRTSTSITTNFTPRNIEDGTVINLNLTLAPEYYRNDDGSINWAELHENATKTTKVTVDSTAPEIVDIEVVKDPETETATAIKVTYKDNEYVAAVALKTERNATIEQIGSDPDAEKGAEATYTFDLTNVTEPHLYVLVGDYAANEATYKINLNEEELENNFDIALNTTSAKVYKNNSITLTVSATPWGADDRVTWASSDETIATVSDKGVVTGISVGTATITATSTFDPEKSVSAEVEVAAFTKKLNGVVMDEEADSYVSEFVLDTLPEYNKLSGALDVDITSMTYDQNGTLYAATFDPDTWLSDLYIVNEDTYELTQVGGSDEISYMDFAPAPSLGNNKLLGVYGTYVLVIDATTGDYDGAFDFSQYCGDNYLVGIAFQHTVYSSRRYNDYYYFVDEAGTLYTTYFYVRNNNPTMNRVTTVTSLGYTTDLPFYNSLYYDGKDLYWSDFNYGDDIVNIIMVENVADSRTRAVYYTGSFAKEVWPVGGLYEIGVKPSDFNSVVVPSDIDEADEEGIAMIEGRIEPLAPRKADGSTNAVVPTAVAARDIKGIDAGTDGAGAAGIVVAITPDEAEGTDYIHNGLYEVTYDPELVKLEYYKSDAKFVSVVNDPGRFVFAYVDEEGYDLDETVLELKFNRLDEYEETYIDVVTKQNDNDHPEDLVRYEFGPGAIVVKENVKSVAFDADEAFAVVEGTVELNAVVTPDNALDKSVTYESADEYIATVDETGVVTGHHIGTTTITVTTNDGGFTDTIDVTVYFTDVTIPESYWFAPVYWAAELGITKGYMLDSQKETGIYGSFGAEENCTREQMITFLWRAVGKPEPQGTTSHFADVKPGDYYFKAVLWAEENGITKGYTSGPYAGKFGVGLTVTREDTVTFIYRTAKYEGFDTKVTSGDKAQYSFTDVTTGYFVDPIVWAAKNGITKGYTSGPNKGKFGVGFDVLRKDIITFLYRYDENVR